MRPAIPDELEQSRLVAIMRRTETSAAVAIAEALVSGGIPTLEVTCDSPGALDMIRVIRGEMGDRVFVGAGTVLDKETAESALEAGARFLVSPHLDAELVEMFARRGVPWIPGAFTATEVLSAWRAGAIVVKLFPAGPVGPAYVRDLRGPLRDVPLLPTGGVTVDNAADFLAAGAWGLGLGSALVDNRLVAEKRFDEIESRARRLTQAVAHVRSPDPTTVPSAR
jgi:2-dehydro-3-deoxyphosphogluconate aldolase/(4S)-4-hydroxy-2-oxoglutarate aldolase